MDIQHLQKRIGEIYWAHILDFGNGIWTPGLWRPKTLDEIGCPRNLRGLTVLDIGAADGGYSFQLEERGAARVLATDSYLWGDCPGTSKAAFDLAHETFHSSVESKRVDVLEHSPETVGVFDLVLVLGVLYHMRHPLLALERVFSVTGNQLILETHVDLLNCDRPALAFYPGDELNGDPSNWWGPNVAAMEAMLTTVGFQKVQLFALNRCEAKQRRLFGWPWGKGKAYKPAANQGRAIFHAWR